MSGTGSAPAGHDPRTCPECGSIETRVVHTEQDPDRIVHVRTCKDCPTSFDVEYGDPLISNVRTFETSADQDQDDEDPDTDTDADEGAA